MAAAKPRRTQVEAIDDLTAEIRLSNQIALLSLGVTALEHDEGKGQTHPKTIARTARRNELRASIRAALGNEES